MEPIVDDVLFFFFPTATSLLIVFRLVTFVDAVNLKECGARLQRQQNATWNTVYEPEYPPPLRLSYEQCLVECGAGIGDVNWQGLSPNFGAWLLPWIGLMFQIPFGAERECYLLASVFR